MHQKDLEEFHKEVINLMKVLRKNQVRYELKKI